MTSPPSDVSSAAIPLSERIALSVEEAGLLVGISRDLAYDLVAQGDIPSVRLGRRLVVPRKPLEEAILAMAQGSA